MTLQRRLDLKERLTHDSAATAIVGFKVLIMIACAVPAVIIWDVAPLIATACLLAVISGIVVNLYAFLTWPGLPGSEAITAFLAEHDARQEPDTAQNGTP